MRNFLNHVLPHWARTHRVAHDLLIAALLVLPVLVFLLWADAFDRVYEASRAHED